MPAVTAETNALHDSEAAIARVLAAERAADEQVRGAEGEAAGRLDAARARARAVTVATARRVARVRTAFARKVAAELAAIDGEAASIAVPALGSLDTDCLDAAVARLVAELTQGPG